jgi:hypothetical protein
MSYSQNENPDSYATTPVQETFSVGNTGCYVKSYGWLILDLYWKGICGILYHGFILLHHFYFQAHSCQL